MNCMSELVGDNTLMSFHCDWNETSKASKRHETSCILQTWFFQKKYDSFIAISHESLELHCLVSNVNLNVQTSFQVFYCMCFEITWISNLTEM